jgi:hypothetical protein
VIDAVPWTVTLVCGASGVGKSLLARSLAARYGVPLAEADDIVAALQAITTAEQQPLLHFWETHDQSSWRPEQIAELHFQVCSALRPAYTVVIATMWSSRPQRSSRATSCSLSWRWDPVARCARSWLMNRMRVRSWRTTCDESQGHASWIVPGSVRWSVRSWHGALVVAGCLS